MPTILPMRFVKPATKATTSTPTSIRSIRPGSRRNRSTGARRLVLTPTSCAWCLLIDGDAERDHPKGGKICTTDAEHEAALAKIQAIQQYLIEQGCPADAIIDNDSGNGGALLLGIDLPNVPASVESRSAVSASPGAEVRRSRRATLTRPSAIPVESRGFRAARTTSCQPRIGPTGCATRSQRPPRSQSPRSNSSTRSRARRLRRPKRSPTRRLNLPPSRKATARNRS